MTSSKKEAIEAEVLAQAGVRAGPALEHDGWMVDGSLIYRLNDKGVNCDEINITMVNGSRATEVRHDAAVELLAELTRTAPTTPAQVPAAEVRRAAFNEAADLCATLRPSADRFDLAAAIRSLAQSSTADKASEVRAAESLSSATDEAMQRAARDLPEFYEVRIELENGCGSVVWYEPDGTRHRIDSDGHFSDDINEAVDAALAHAAAPSTADSGNSGALGEGAEA